MPKARLEGVLDINNKPFVKGMNEAVAKAKKSGHEMKEAMEIGTEALGALGIGLGAAGFFEFSKSVVEFASKLGDSAIALNLNVESLQGLEGAFSQSGVSAEQFEKAMFKLNETMDAARDGDEKATKAFQRLGVSMEDVALKSPEEILYMLADGMKNATDKTQALAALMDVLGKAGKNLAAGLSEGAEGLKEMSGAIDKLTTEQIKHIKELEDAWTRCWIGLKVEGGKYIDDTIQEMNGLEAVAKRIAGITIADIFGGGTPDLPTPKTKGDQSTGWRMEEEKPVYGPVDYTPLGPTMSAAEKRQLEAANLAEENRKKDIVDRNKLEQDAYQHTLKMQEQIRKVIHDGIFDGLDGEQKLKVLTAERAQIMADAAKLGAYTEEQKLAYAEKSVEIAKQIRENEKDTQATAMQAAAANAINTSGLRTGPGRNAYDRSADAYHLVRRGDAARARAEKANEGRDPILSKAAATARNTANLAKAFGVGGTEDL